MRKRRNNDHQRAIPLKQNLATTIEMPGLSLYIYVNSIFINKIGSCGARH